MRAKTLVLSCLLGAGAAQAADVRPIPPSSVASGAPQTVQDVAPRSRDANAGNPFPCLFGCFGDQPVQTAAAPAEVAEPVEIRPRRQAHRKWTQHAFVQSRSAKQEGRSVATARKVSRPAAPQAVV